METLQKSNIIEVSWTDVYFDSVSICSQKEKFLFDEFSKRSLKEHLIYIKITAAILIRLNMSHLAGFRKFLQLICPSGSLKYLSSDLIYNIKAV